MKVLNIKYSLQLIAAFFLLLGLSCSKDDSVELLNGGYPERLVGNWVAFEFPGGEIEGTVHPPYDLVSALDPNRENQLILDNLYNSGIRTRAAIEYDTSFTVTHGEQLNKINSSDFGIKSVSLFGFVNQNPVIINLAYQFAQISFPDMAFDESAIEDVIFINAGYYDKERAIVDTVLIIGYRKTGFEEVKF